MILKKDVTLLILNEKELQSIRPYVISDVCNRMFLDFTLRYID